MHCSQVHTPVSLLHWPPSTSALMYERSTAHPHALDKNFDIDTTNTALNGGGKDFLFSATSIHG